MSEKWKDVKGYEGHYKVSDRGRVISCARRVPGSDGRHITMKERILKPTASKSWRYI